MAGHVPFTWFSHIPILGSLPHQVSMGLFVLVMLCLLSYLGFKKRVLASGEAALVPPERLTVRNIFEIFTEMILKFLDDIIGHRGRQFLPLIGTLGFFILFSNLLGLVPGFPPAHGQLEHDRGLRPGGFLRDALLRVQDAWDQIPPPFSRARPVACSLDCFIIELISHLARVLSLSMRLFGNIMADHMLLSLTLAAPLILPLFLSPLSMFLGVFVSLIQTFIFILLSMIYISLAIEEAEH